MNASISAIEFHIPQSVLANNELAQISSRWSSDKIEAKTGIRERHITAATECSSDLAVAAAEKLFGGGAVRREEIDFVLMCTQSPDYLLPTTACLVQERLGLSNAVGALDVNLGCSGFVYGLGLAKGLIESAQAENLLLITADTYSKFIRPQDLNVRTLFGDGAAATLIRKNGAAGAPGIGPMVYGTDGSGAENLIVRQSGLRIFEPDDDTELTNDRGRLYMNGPQIVTFTLKAVPQLVDAMLEKAECTMDDVDLFVFHQANQYLLDHLRHRIGIPEERFYCAIKHYGNTVSSTIPIALKHAQWDGRLRPNDKVMLVGFGVGYSWGATFIRPSQLAQTLRAAA